MLLRASVVGLVALFAATAGMRVALGRFTLNRDAPMVSVPPRTAPVGPPARRVLLIVLDGARRDAVARVPSLSGFAARADVEAELPTISAAQYVSLLSGVPPQHSGRRSNERIGPVGVESVPDLVRAAGGKAQVFSDCVDWWTQLFPRAFDEQLTSPTSFAASSADFVLVHLCAFDDAGHAFGAAHDAYRVDAAAKIEATLREVLRAWGETGPVVVTSDHGHRDAGGHGGDEDEVRHSFVLARGPGILPAANVSGRLVDVASTLSALLRLPPPSTNEGRPLRFLDDTSDDAAVETAARATFLGAEKKRQELEHAALWVRLLRALGFLTIGLFALGVLRRERIASLQGLAAGLAMMSLSALGHWLTVGSVSLSGHRAFGELILTAVKLGAGAALMPLGWSLWLQGRQGASAALCFLLGAAVGSCPLAVWMLVVFGVSAPRISIDSSWALALPPLANAAWFGSLCLLLVGIASALVSRRAQAPASR